MDMLRVAPEEEASQANFLTFGASGPASVVAIPGRTSPQAQGALRMALLDGAFPEWWPIRGPPQLQIFDAGCVARNLRHENMHHRCGLPGTLDGLQSAAVVHEQ